MVDTLPNIPKKGRGAVGNPAGRFETESTVSCDDGWDNFGDDDAPVLRTTLTPDATRTVITRNKSPDVPFDRSINPYRGCEHGCVYCFARPTHSYLGLSPGLDFESRLFFKRDAAALLEKELRRPSYRCATIALGVNTDAYQPVERELKLTRSILEVLSAFNHPVAIITKSAGILRDMDLLAAMAEKKLVHVMISVTTLDADLHRRMEPRAPRPSRRLEVIRTLTEAGIPAGVLAAPMIPGLTDQDLESILETAAAAGAHQAGYILMRLPHELKDLFLEWLGTHYPDRAGRVESLLRQCRGGGLNHAEFGRRMRGDGVYADLLSHRFKVAIDRLELNRREFDLDSSLFKPPTKAGDQLALF